MTTLSKILTADHVILELDAGSKKRVFERIGVLFEPELGLSRRAIFESLFAREKLGSTGLGQGVAIPHGRIKGLKRVACAFIRLAHPIAFEAPDGAPVNLLFVLLVPEQATEEHLQILSALAQRFSQREFREALTVAPDAASVLSLFQKPIELP